MDLKVLEEIKEWFNTTDLTEISYRKEDLSVTLVKEGYSDGDFKINSNLIPVFSPEVGIFSFSKKGKGVDIKKGDKVRKNDVLGYINLPSKVVEVRSPVDGIVRLVAVEEGKVVEYSQLLFVIE